MHLLHLHHVGGELHGRHLGQGALEDVKVKYSRACQLKEGKIICIDFNFNLFFHFCEFQDLDREWEWGVTQLAEHRGVSGELLQWQGPPPAECPVLVTLHLVLITFTDIFLSLSYLYFNSVRWILGTDGRHTDRIWYPSLNF